MLHPGTSNHPSSSFAPEKWLQNLQGTWCWPPPHGTRCSFQWTTPGRHFLPVQLQVGHGWRFLGWRRDEKSCQVASLSSGIHGVYPYTRCRCMATIHPSNMAAEEPPWFRFLLWVGFAIEGHKQHEIFKSPTNNRKRKKNLAAFSWKNVVPIIPDSDGQWLVTGVYLCILFRHLLTSNEVRVSNQGFGNCRSWNTLANHRTFQMHKMGGPITGTCWNHDVLWRKVHGKVWGMTCQTCHFTLHLGSCAMGCRSPLRFHIWPLGPWGTSGADTLILHILLNNA